MRLPCLLLALLSITATAGAGERTQSILVGRVVHIASGDTLTIVDPVNVRYKIHLLGIAAPDVQQPFGRKSRTSLSALAFNQQVHAFCRLQDPMQHPVCVVEQRGRDLGLEQLRNGAAWAYPPHAERLTDGERSTYRQAEFFAKLHRSGLWNSKNPTPPWIWNKGRAE
ncbi:MAG: thermonuclease family protein [Propionivibrio sp.]